MIEKIGENLYKEKINMDSISKSIINEIVFGERTKELLKTNNFCGEFFTSETKSIILKGIDRISTVDIRRVAVRIKKILYDENNKSNTIDVEFEIVDDKKKYIEDLIF